MRNINKVGLPPEDLHICFGGGDFHAIGQKMINICKSDLNLFPDARVLDIGCGIGRLCFPLLEFLSETGEYEGFDTFPVGIKWCSENITPEFPNFGFKLVDIYNSTYNPGAKVKGSDFKFPYEENRFDLAMLNSVFTHMMPDEIINYIQEMNKVLNDQGNIFATFFLVNKESNELMNQGKSVHDLHKFGVFYTADPSDPMDAVGYEENFVINLFKQAGFKLKEIKYGNWCGRKANNHQDIMLFTR